MSIISLKSSREFDSVTRCSTKKNGRYFLVLSASNLKGNSASSGDVFLGMKVSRKFSKKAVIRNKTKRRIRHLLQNLVNNESLEMKKNTFIVIPKKTIHSASFADLSKDFASLCL